MRYLILVSIVSLLILPEKKTWGQPTILEPPTNVQATDTPNDAGGSIAVSWNPSPGEVSGRVTEYRILRREVVSAHWEAVGEVPAGIQRFVDSEVLDGIEFVYAVEASDGQLNSMPALSLSAQSIPQWFHRGRINALIATLLLAGAILYFIKTARSGKALYIRKIAGLEAVDEAVGRATEMGRKVFYIPGSGDLDDVQTIAAIIILGRVARKTAELETLLEVPVRRSLVMTTAREVVKQAYIDAGRPDVYHDEMVNYLTEDQFGYAAGVDGMIIRDRPAAIFFQGRFLAESLIMAETGNSVGAIQIAGTGMPAQLPFFVAACDYTLIGEELFAASAYLSREPRLMGSLKGQDVGKFLVLVAIVIGVILKTLGLYDLSNLFTVQ